MRMQMKYLLGFLLTGLILFSCDGYKAPSQTAKGTAAVNDTVRIANDSLDYEIIIIEPGFYNWLVTQFPEDYYTLSFLENRNLFYVQEYNRRVINPNQYDSQLYLWQIDYQPNVKYGKEVNYLLYNWFIYFQQTYKQKL